MPSRWLAARPDSADSPAASPGSLPAATTTVLLCFSKADSSACSSGWGANEPGEPLHAAIREWQQAGVAVGGSTRVRKVEAMQISVRAGCPSGTAGARGALDWIRANAD